MSDIRDLQSQMYASSLDDVERFIKLAECDGYKCLKANNYQDKYEHWDVLLIKDDKSGRVDVKGYKESHKSGFTWVEFQTVNGKRGWIKGKAHAIAFELEDRFILVNRLELKKFVESRIVNPTGYVYLKPDDLSEIAYHRYRRMGRRDIVIIVPFSDMEEFIMKTFYK